MRSSILIFETGTYISGVTAIRSLTRQEFATNPSEWADCILRGVVAFHAAARSNTHLKGYSHIEEALPYVMEVLGKSKSDAGANVVCNYQLCHYTSCNYRQNYSYSFNPLLTSSL